jgi:hypothetical protein
VGKLDQIGDAGQVARGFYLEGGEGGLVDRIGGDIPHLQRVTVGGRFRGKLDRDGA